VGRMWNFGILKVAVCTMTARL